MLQNSTVFYEWKHYFDKIQRHNGWRFFLSIFHLFQIPNDVLRAKVLRYTRILRCVVLVVLLYLAISGSYVLLLQKKNIGNKHLLVLRNIITILFLYSLSISIFYNFLSMFFSLIFGSIKIYDMNYDYLLLLLNIF